MTALVGVGCGALGLLFNLAVDHWRRSNHYYSTIDARGWGAR